MLHNYPVYYGLKDHEFVGKFYGTVAAPRINEPGSKILEAGSGSTARARITDSIFIFHGGTFLHIEFLWLLEHSLRAETRPRRL